MIAENRTRILIIGSGPAGYTTAIYAARANLKPILVSGNEPGGQLMITTDVENYPGFRDTIQGPWLMQEMRAQVESVGTIIKSDTIVKIFTDKTPFVCKSENRGTYIADSIVIATGAQAKWLGLTSENKFRGFGVSGCATCDGFFFRGKKVVVIGGGDTAVEEALFLINHAAEVTLIHRRDALRAEKIMQDRLFSHPKIKIIWNSTVEEFIGEENPTGLTGVKIRNTQTSETSVLDVDGAFVAIGHKPSTDYFKDAVEIDDHGYIICTPGGTKTSVPGIFAAGDVQDRIYRQAVTAAGQGCMAAMDAEKYLISTGVL